jgi:anti-sigma-K factor RskA
MIPDDHSALEQELAAYLLDALTPEEASRFEAHMAACERCQADARWLGAAAEALPVSVEQVEPPPELRERLLQVVRREAAVTREAARARPATARARLWRPFGAALRPATALAAASVVVAAGLAGYLIRGEEEPKATTVQAQFTPAAPSARATVVRTNGSAILRVDRLPVQRPGHVYQVWLRPRGTTRVEPSTLFVVRPDGRGSAAIPEGLEDVGEVMVSMEPSGGSRRPSSKPVLRAVL